MENLDTTKIEVDTPSEISNVNFSNLKSIKQAQKDEQAEKPKVEQPDDSKELPKVEEAVEQEEVKDENPKEKVAVEETTAKAKKADEDASSRLSWLDDEEEPKEKVKEVEKLEKVSSEIPQEYIDKAKNYDDIVKNPLFKALEGFFKSGNTDINEFVSIVGVPDYGKMYSNGQFEELYKKELEADGLSEEEMEQAMEDFKEMPTYKQRAAVKGTVERLKKEGQDKLNALTEGFYEKERGQRDEMNKAAVKAVSELDQWVEKTTDKSFMGMAVTKEVADLIKQGVMEKAELTPDGKGYDIETSIRVAIARDKKLFKKLVKDNIDLAKVAGYDEAMRERTRTNRREEAPGGAAALGKKDVSKAISSLGVVKDAAEKK